MGEYALQIDSHQIRRDGDMWCLTDLWRAAGSERNHRPVEWLRGADAKKFIEFLSTTLEVGNSHLVKSSKKAGTSTGGDTWAHWQLALAYAGWISPAFRARVNEVYKAYRDGQLIGRDLTESRWILRLEAARRDEYVSVWDVELKLLLARMYGVKGWTPGEGSEPRQLASAYGAVWRWILGDKVYRDLKERNPYPRGGSLHGQWIRDEARELIRREDLAITLALARRSVSWAQFKSEMVSQFRRAPVQLRLPSAREAA